MKKKFVLTGFLGFTFLFGCNQIDNGEVSASTPNGFSLVTKTDIGMRNDALELVHNETKCHYLYVDGVQKAGLIQMFVEKDGASVPYCEK